EANEALPKTIARGLDSGCCWRMNACGSFPGACGSLTATAIGEGSWPSFSRSSPVLARRSRTCWPGSARKLVSTQVYWFGDNKIGSAMYLLAPGRVAFAAGESFVRALVLVTG